MNMYGMEADMKEVKKFEKNMDKYELLEVTNFESLELLPDEKIAHCIDKDYYENGWIITNKGRIWSITDNRWLVPWLNEKGYWRIANAYVHRWVCHYFMSTDDKRILKMVEDHNKECNDTDKWEAEVHHKQIIEKIDNYESMIKTERILACMAVNYKENLIYQRIKDHDDDHNLLKGKQNISDGTAQFDAMSSIMINSGLDSAYTTYGEDGKKQINMTVKIPTLTPEEDEVYSKKVKNFPLGW